MYGELLQLGEENILEEGMVMMIIGDCIGTKDPLIEKDTLMKVGDPLIEEDILMEMGYPLIEENTLVEDPLMEEEDPLNPLEDKDHQALKDLLGP